MEKDKRNENQKNAGVGGRHTDAAEGDRDTVDESIRSHEKKGDLPDRGTKEDADKKNS